MAFKRMTTAVALCLFSCVLCGCEPADTPKTETPKTEAQTQADLLAKLAAADAFDGTEDKIISKCAGCALGMDGSENYAVETNGYTLHLCGDRCKKAFDANTTQSVLALRIPKN